MAFVVEPMAKSVCSSTGADLPSSRTPIAALEHDLVVLDHGDGKTRRPPVLDGPGDVVVEAVERLRLCERLQAVQTR